MTPDPLIITVAPNGAYKQPADHKALPIKPADLALTAKHCLDAGAAMLHLHIRDAQGRHSLDVQVNPAFVRANEVKTLCGDATLLRSLIGPWEGPPLRETLRWMLQDGV